MPVSKRKPKKVTKKRSVSLGQIVLAVAFLVSVGTLATRYYSEKTPEASAAPGDIEYRQSTSTSFSSTVPAPTAGTVFNASQYTIANAYEGQYVAVPGTATARPYFIFKYQHANNTDPANFLWSGRSNNAISTTNRIVVEQWNGSSWVGLTGANLQTSGSAWPANTEYQLRANALSYVNVSGAYWHYIRLYHTGAPTTLTLSTNYVKWLHTAAYYSQSSYQFFNDDGRFAGSPLKRNTISHAPNTAATAEAGQQLTVKIHAENIGGNSWYEPWSNVPPIFKLQYRLSGGGTWQTPTSTSPIATASGASDYGAVLPVAIPGSSEACGHPVWNGLPWTANASDRWTDNANSITTLSGFDNNSLKCYLVSYVVRVLPTASPGQSYQLRIVTSNAVGSAVVHSPEDLEEYSFYPTITVASTNRSYSKGGVNYPTQTGRGDWVTSTTPIPAPTNTPVIPAVDASGVVHAAATSSGTSNIIDATYVGPGSGSGCPAGADWTCTIIDPGTLRDYRYEVGKLRMVYGTTSIRYAEYVGSGGSGCAGTSTWTCVTVGSSTLRPLKFAVTSTGTVMIVAANNTGNIDYCEGSIALGWTCRTNLFPGGTRPSIDVTTTNQPRIAYFTGGNVLTVVSCTSGCAAAGGWTAEAIDLVPLGSAGAAVADCDTSMQVDSSGNPHITYCLRFGELLYAHKVASGAAGCRYDGNNTTSGWKCEYVSNTGGNGQDADIELEPISQRVRIALEAEAVNGVQRNYIQSVDTGGTATASNYAPFCVDYRPTTPIAGQKVYNAANWICEKSGAVSADSEGYTNLAFSSDGLPVVAGKTTIAIMKDDLANSFDTGGFGLVATSNDLRSEMLSIWQNPPPITQYASVYQFSQQSASSGATLRGAWEGQSNVAASTKPIYLQVYRFGTTMQWETVATNSTSAANTDFILSTLGWTPGGAASEYYLSRGGEYHVYWRVWQEVTAAGATLNLQTDLWTPAPAFLVVEARQDTQLGALITGQAMSFNVTGAQSLPSQVTAAGTWSRVVTSGDLYSLTTSTPQGSYTYDSGSSLSSGTVPGTGTYTLTLKLVFDPLTIPSVSWTQNPTNITPTTADLWGYVGSFGGAASLSQTGACWSTTNASPILSQVGSGTTCQAFCSSNCVTNTFTVPTTGLAANNSYYYSAYATNTVGTGYFVPPPNRTFNTLPSAPIMQPFTRVLATGVTVNWATPGGTLPLTYYVYRCKQSDCATLGYVLISGSTGLASTVFTYPDSGPLLPGTTYNYSVQASNNGEYGFGPGAVSSVTTASLPTIIVPTVDVITDTGATLGANVTNNGGLALQSRGTCFNTTAQPTSNCASFLPANVLGQFSHVRNTMQPNTFYYARGYASNSGGTAYTSDVTLLTQPRAPTTPTFSNPTATSIQVTWTQNLDGNYTPLNYRVQRCDTPGCSNFVTIAGPQSEKTYTDSGLTEGTTYSYRIIANNIPGNAAGDSAPSGIGTNSTNDIPTAEITQGLPSSIIVGKWYTIIGVGTDNDATTGNEMFVSLDHAPGSAIGQFGTTSNVPAPFTNTVTRTWRATQPGRYQLRLTVSDIVSPPVTADTPTPLQARTLPIWIEVSP